VGHWHAGNYMNTLKPIRLSELKTQASFLLKELRNSSADNRKSAERFLALPGFEDKTSQWIAEHLDAIQLKHAYLVLAVENGFTSWTEFRRIVIDKDCLYKSSSVGFIHSWFNHYPQAEAYHLRHGGYLLSFWDDYVVCGEEYINRIGLDIYQEQWRSIGYDWVAPKNRNAWTFLNEKARLNYINQK